MRKLLTFLIASLWFAYTVGPRCINGVFHTCSYNSVRLKVMDVFGLSVSISDDLTKSK
jgi:hypothetical protein